jgi:uncharacterized protein with HEPN domain
MTPRREFRDYLQDILETMDKVERFIGGMTFEQFLADDRTSFAVVRALEIIGEATKHIPHPSGADIRKLPGRAWLECETS